MKNTLKKLWNDYLLDGCAAFSCEEERELSKIAAEKHEIVNQLLSVEQRLSVEAYIDALCDIHSCFAEKAFSKGCEFAMSFFAEIFFKKK